jgi:hypothetical protein
MVSTSRTNRDRITAPDVAAGARFLARLPGFLRRRLDLERARRVLRTRFERRETDFLSMVREFIFDRGSSPYRPLFRHAGCELGDVERLVNTAGVEGALAALLRDGVYLRVEEYKGRTPVRRGSLEYPVAPASLRNPLSKFHIPVRSSGSRSAGTPVLIDFDFVADCAVNCHVMMHARGTRPWTKADWEVPGGGAMFRLLKFSQFGTPPSRWFSQLDPASPGLHPRYRWSARAMRWGSLLSGVPLPPVQHVPLESPLPIARWMITEVAAGNAPCLFTFPSSAVTLCLAAAKAGLALDGAAFFISGEPITQARLDVIRATGARVIPRFGTIECGPIGYGCQDPEASDDMHLNHDLHAIVQAADAGGDLGVPDQSLFLTALRPSTPFIFLNVSMGDQAVLSRRLCGCPLEAEGWTRHAHSIRSFEKLTGAGMTFMDGDIIRVLEEVLPARFGGSPTDYQMVEEEGERGEPILRLLIRPELGPIDEAAVKETFLNSLSGGSGVERVMGLTWKQAGILRVDRRPPVTTTSGKILHLSVRRRTADGRSHDGRAPQTGA